MDFDIECKSLRVEHSFNRRQYTVKVDLIDVSEDEILGNFSLVSIIDYFGEDELLKCIGKEKAIKTLGIDHMNVDD